MMRRELALVSRLSRLRSSKAATPLFRWQETTSPRGRGPQCQGAGDNRTRRKIDDSCADGGSRASLSANELTPVPAIIGTATACSIANDRAFREVLASGGPIAFRFKRSELQRAPTARAPPGAAIRGYDDWLSVRASKGLDAPPVP